MSTELQYAAAIAPCREIFEKKTLDYGTSWRVYRIITVADQIYIKARRIRNIQNTGLQKINDDIRGEFIGMYNYAIIGLIQLEINNDEVEELAPETAMKFYEKYSNEAFELMLKKNHDYGEAWRDMSQESFTDLILSKLLRIKQIIANSGKTVASEGIDANLYDIMNYSVFALILETEIK